jgi:hypothetical protein
MKKIYTPIAVLTLILVFSAASFAQTNRVKSPRGNRPNIVQNSGQSTRNNRVVTPRPKPIYIDDIIIGAKNFKKPTTKSTDSQTIN